MKNNKPVTFSGIQPSGELHIGNYLGAISQWVDMQGNYSCIFCIVDYHAITVRQDPKKLNKNIREIAKIYLALGIDPKKSVIFQQSSINEHTELAWILNCIARISDLNKMTQFKDKADKNQEKVTVGLYDYPVLMAADILLYNTDQVPVGKDQSQHVELSRTLAKRFNKRFGQTFRIPGLKLRKQGANIMGLDNPEKKMSKSAESKNNYIALTDAPEIAVKKIKKAVTDSGSEIKYDPKNKKAISNLLTIYSILDNKPINNLEKKYKNSNYGKFKDDLAQIVQNFLKEFQAKYNRINDKQVDQVLENGADKIRPIAKQTIQRVKSKIGIN
ncbi:MAG: tryptophan--tRNA ligase [Candidatus Moranbacteria bacterium]|nr:tryptophan--tRNA ligase [Candidatus Moranbacteria bacterium]